MALIGAAREDEAQCQCQRRRRRIVIKTKDGIASARDDTNEGRQGE